MKPNIFKKIILILILILCVTVFVFFVNKKSSILPTTIINDTYQSSATSTITLSQKDYDQKIKTLPPIQTFEQILAKTEDAEQLKDHLQKQIEQYGDLATRFLPSDEISSLEKFDVDNDGKEEIIIYLCGLTGNHCPHSILIVKEGKIIFSTSAGLGGLDLITSDTGNGFYLHWIPTESDPKWNTGLCCPIGYVSTRFVFEDNKFKPVYEYENLYSNAKDVK